MCLVVSGAQVERAIKCWTFQLVDQHARLGRALHGSPENGLVHVDPLAEDIKVLVGLQCCSSLTSF